MQQGQKLRLGSACQNTFVVRWHGFTAALLLGDPMADLAEPRVAIQAVLMGQETKRSPEPALLTDEGQPFATRIIFLKREGGKTLSCELKKCLQAVPAYLDGQPKWSHTGHRS